MLANIILHCLNLTPYVLGWRDSHHCTIAIALGVDAQPTIIASSRNFQSWYILILISDRWAGVLVVAVGGLMYALYVPAFNVATNDNFGFLPRGVPPLSIYATLFYFGIGFAGISMVRSELCALLRTACSSSQ